MGTLRQMGLVTIFRELVGSPVCQVPLQRLGRPCRTASHRLSGVGGAFGARWGLGVPCRGQEECSSEQQVEVAAGKGSSPGIIGLSSEGRLGHMAG